MNRLLTFFTIAALLAILPTSCLKIPPSAPQTSPTDSAQINAKLEEAASQWGVNVPLPTYLPAGYEISRIETAEPKIVILHLTRHAGTSADEITFQVQWRPGVPIGIKLPGTRVNITGSPNNFEQGVIVDRNDHNDLWWDGIPNLSDTTSAHYEFMISASKQVSTDELVKIGRSVRLPTSPITTSPTPFTTGQIKVMGFGATPGDAIPFEVPLHSRLQLLW